MSSSPDDQGEAPPRAQAVEALTIVPDAAALHAELFAEYSEAAAKKVSRLEREAKQLANRSLAYGEIPFQTVAAIFQLLRNDFGVLLDKGGSFYDLGSGCGKVVMAAALLHDFSKCCGVELLDGLHGMALKVLDHWRYKLMDTLPASKADVDVGFARGDATDAELWRDATLVFCNATCFSDSLVTAISAAADQLRAGTYFISITKPLASKQWQLIVERKFPMSWGRATVIVQKKVI